MCVFDLREKTFMIKYYASWSFKTGVLYPVMKTPFISSLLNYVVYLAFIHHRASYITSIYLLSVLLMLWHFGGLTDLRNWPSWGLANVKQSQGSTGDMYFIWKTTTDIITNYSLCPQSLQSQEQTSNLISQSPLVYYSN